MWATGAEHRSWSNSGVASVPPAGVEEFAELAQRNRMTVALPVDHALPDEGHELVGDLDVCSRRRRLEGPHHDCGRQELVTRSHRLRAEGMRFGVDIQVVSAGVELQDSRGAAAGGAVPPVRKSSWT